VTVAIICRAPGRGPGRRVTAGLALLALLATLLGCRSDDPDMPPAQDSAPPQQEPVSPLDDCAALSGPPPQAAARDPAESPGNGEGRAGAPSLPELSLPCFTGGEPVALEQLRGPAVVNLWASWCPPCREELPVLQEYAERTAGSVHVVGVVTEDARGAAAAFAAEAGVTFPGLFDREGRARAQLSAVGLPVTLFVDADGRVVHLHQGPPLDADGLAELSTEHLGVAP
jgi:thiol-disulfide isomerase/thioredoxin